MSTLSRAQSKDEALKKLVKDNPLYSEKEIQASDHTYKVWLDRVVVPTENSKTDCRMVPHHSNAPWRDQNRGNHCAAFLLERHAYNGIRCLQEMRHLPTY
jgi:hypothetical protein